jgi:hypothetical protein
MLPGRFSFNKKNVNDGYENLELELPTVKMQIFVGEFLISCPLILIQ